MSQLRVAKVSEVDFDQMIIAAGGRKVALDPSIEKNPNADYEIDDAFVELKLVEEEGLEKDSRRRKIAALFHTLQPDCPVVVVDPAQINDDDKRRYFNIMAGPIQTAIKQAAKQLEATRVSSGGDGVRVLVAINNGYTALSHEEFMHVVLKAARQDTMKIDSVVVGGIYYYSDQFDSYVLFPLKECPINVTRTFHAFSKLQKQWCEFSERVMTALIHGDDPDRCFEKMPVVDIAFDVGSVSYVKPAPKMGIHSEFWAQGRPRCNSTGMTVCPPVAQTIPDIDAPNWKLFQKALPGSAFFQKRYIDWARIHEKELSRSCEPTKPLIPVAIVYENVVEWCQQSGSPLSEKRVFSYAAYCFDKATRDLIAGAISRSTYSIIPSRYILVETHEIGRDRAYDYSSIRLVRETLSGANVQELVGNIRIFHEHALALAAAYALKWNVDIVLYDRIQTYAWV